MIISLAAKGSFFRLPRNTVHGYLQPAAKDFQYNHDRRRTSTHLISTTSRSPNGLLFFRAHQSHCMFLISKKQRNSNQYAISCHRLVIAISTPSDPTTTARLLESLPSLSKELLSVRRIYQSLLNRCLRQTYPPHH